MENNVLVINEKIKLLAFEISKMKNRSRQFVNNNVLDSDYVSLITEGGPGNQKAIAAGEDIKDNFRKNKKNRRNKFKF